MSTSSRPSKLGKPGSAVWDDVTGRFDLDTEDREVLVAACRTADLLADLESAVAREGVTLESPQGVRVHPAVQELRQQRLTLARLVAALRLPDDPAQGRPQRRPLRGVQQPRQVRRTNSAGRELKAV